MHVAVITCSDRVHAGTYEDRSGPTLVDGLRAAGVDARGERCVPDEVPAIRDAILDAARAGARVVVTSGGTGLGPRDVTPEATRGLLDHEVPGIAEAIRRRGPEPHAMLSRGLAGIATIDGVRVLVVNVAGSVGAARDAVAVLAPALTHVVDQLDGGGH